MSVYNDKHGIVFVDLDTVVKQRNYTPKETVEELREYHAERIQS